MRSVGVLVVSQYDFVIEEVYESWRMKLETISLIGESKWNCIFSIIEHNRIAIVTPIRRFNHMHVGCRCNEREEILWQVRPWTRKTDRMM